MTPSSSPPRAASGDTGARFSSDAAQASGLYRQVNMGSAAWAASNWSSTAPARR
jgi:hypothetical protein